MNPTNEQIRYYIFVRHKLGESATEIHNQLVEVHGNSAPSYSSVTDWIRQLQAGRQTLQDEPRSGRPADVVNERSIALVKEKINEDKRVTVRELSAECALPRATIHRIIQEHLHMKKLCSRWIPHLLTIEQKRERVRISQELLRLLEKRRLSDIVTGDESWLYFYQMASKTANMVWLEDEEPRPEVCRQSFRSQKRMFSVFINYRGPVCIDMLPEGQHINGHYYASTVLPQVVNCINEQRPKTSTSRILFHQDNASCHGTQEVKQYIASQHMTIIPHPAYSPDLAPLDFWVWPKLKADMSGLKFHRVQDLAKAVHSQLNSYGEDWYRKCLEQWTTRLQKCIDEEGGYVEGLR
jgi:histone-lysine N-methyltransferase SETMAR